MDRLAIFVVTKARLAWLIAFLIVAASTLLSAQAVRQWMEKERLTWLAAKASQMATEITFRTISNHVMGGISLAGALDVDIKKDALGAAPLNAAKTLEALEGLGQHFSTHGVFVVGADGVVRSSWDALGKPSTGLDIKFRPYYQMGMRGKDNIYAAVSLARGDRSLYYAAPVFQKAKQSGDVVGVLVARSTPTEIDRVLVQNNAPAFLASPQGVIFASNRPEWIGALASRTALDRLDEIRRLRQFGNQFEKDNFKLIPLQDEGEIFTHEGVRYAKSARQIEWNDPLGPWSLIVLEDLDQAVAEERYWLSGLGVGVVVFSLLLLSLHMLRGRYAQTQISHELKSYAAQQSSDAVFRTQLSHLGTALQQISDVAGVCRAVLSFCHETFGCLQGVIYVREVETGLLHRAAMFGGNDSVPRILLEGEGLLGQAMQDGELKVISRPVHAEWEIYSGLGACVPETLWLVPVHFQEDLVAGIELGFATSPPEDFKARLGAVGDLLALNLETTQRNLRTQESLALKVASEQQIADQLSFQQALMDNIPYPVFFKGPDSRFLGVNRAYKQVFGVSEADLVGKKVLDLAYLPEQDRVAYQAEDERIIANQDSIQREMQMPFADGRLHDTLYFVSGFSKRDGSPGGLVGTFIDISSLKEAERALSRMADVERFNRLALARETRILELKQQVNALVQAAGGSAPFNSLTEDELNLLDENLAAVELPASASETDSSLNLEDLVDLQELQTLFTSFCDAVGIASAIIDLEGKVLVSARWQVVCTDFHRVNPVSCARCIESDTDLANQLNEGKDFSMYRCKNGMTDCASPIVVEGRHLANVFIGQFHLGEPDIGFFSRQADELGMDRERYLSAVKAAPVMSEARLPLILDFLTGFARMIATMSLAQRRADKAQHVLEIQAELLQKERLAAVSLAEDAEQARREMTSQRNEVVE